MTRKSFATLGIVVVLLASLVGTVAAQTGTTPTVSPTPTSDAATTSLYAHPIVQILAAYFGRDTASDTLTPTTPTETETPDASDTETETATADASATADATTTATATATTAAPTGQETLAQQIETYHQEGIGFGVLVKLYAMAEASKIACPTAPTAGATPVPTTVTSNGGTTDTTTTTDTTQTTTCTAVTIDQLVQQFKSGTGMGLLFKEYGKPSLLGVGHVKHALLAAEQQATVTDGTPQPTLSGSLTTNKHLKNNKLKQHGNPNKGNNGQSNTD